MSRLVPGVAAVAVLWLAAIPPATAGDTRPIELAPVRVEAIRLDIAPFELPASFSVLPVAPGASGKPGVNLSEVLSGVPGVLARDRQNYAQDEQLSIRGFGARAGFGVRGVRLYADGIPATMPDGQGQLSHFNLDAAGRVEVLRGPFSALYGNSSGGVVQLWSAEGEATPITTLAVSTGSDASTKLGVNARGIAGPMNYNLALSRFRTAGYRAHSRAQRDAGNARLGFDLGAGRRLTVVANALLQPHAQDPLGLTRAQYLADPRQAPAVATAYDTRKRVHQQQLGVTYQQPLGGRDELRVMAYAGARAVDQMLSIPPVAQRSPLAAGGVVDLSGGYGGLDARWTRRATWFGRPLELVVGASYDAQKQRRRGYENFVGDALGVRGRLRRDEYDRVEAIDQYAQLYWKVAARWALLAGVRRSTVRFRVDDRYVTADNPDDSGRVRHAAITPVAGVQFRPDQHWRLYASAGAGFETPTFAELGYRADGRGGLAFNLRPARSRNQELGAKWQVHGKLALELALFRADTRDEIAVAGSSGGRTTYRNIGPSRRRGAEASLHGKLAGGWRLQLGFTELQAHFRRAPGDCVAAACFGSRLPGVPREYGSLRLERGAELGWRGGLEFDGAAALAVDDRNSAFAPGYLRTGVDAGYGVQWHDARLHVGVRIDNLFNRRIIGSVIVNDSNGRYFEPAPGRSWMVNARLEL